MHIILHNYICVPNKETIIVTATATATNVTHVFIQFLNHTKQIYYIILTLRIGNYRNQSHKQTKVVAKMLYLPYLP